MTSDLLDIDLGEVRIHNPPVGKIRKLLKHLSGDDYILEIDHSSMESVLTCMRSALWKLIYSRSTYPTSALTYGSAVHSAMEVLHRQVAQSPDLPININDLLVAGEAHFMLNPPGTGEYRNYELFSVAIAKYLKHYNNNHFKPILINNIPAVELPFAQPLGEIEVNAVCPFDQSLVVGNASSIDDKFFIKKIHIVWTGIIDLIVEQNSQLYIVDHKTSSILGDSYFKAFELSQQLRGYQWATEKLLGQEISGGCLNVIASRKPTSKEELFFRRFYPYPRHRITEWPTSIMALISNFIHALMTSTFPEETVWCVGKFGVCPYHDVCSEEPDLRLPTLATDKYCDNVWNPIDS